MKIIFKYYFDKTKNKFMPTCDSESGENGVLISYLNDSLGDKDKYKEFLNDNLNILLNDIDEDISSNSWGVDIVDDSVYIFFLYDQNNELYKVKMPKIEFVFIIKQWVKFLDEPISNSNCQEIIDSEDAYK